MSSKQMQRPMLFSLWILTANHEHNSFKKGGIGVRGDIPIETSEVLRAECDLA